MKEVDISEFKNKKIALVLSGGVTKAAAWHLGVGLALEEMGFTLKSNTSSPSKCEISTYVGSSAGALINLYFASGFKPIDVIEAFLDPKNSSLTPITYRDMLSMKKLITSAKKNIEYNPLNGFPYLIKKILSPLVKRSGFFTTWGLQEYIEKNIIKSNEFADYSADMFVVGTQLDHSRKVVFGKYNYPNPKHDFTTSYYIDTPVSVSVAASMSVPPLYAPYPIKNEYTGETDYYIDGEIRETLSTHVAADNKCDVAISSWTHTPYHYQSEIGSLVNYGLPAIAAQAVYLIIQKKILTARDRLFSSKNAIDTVYQYMKNNNISEEHRKNIITILEQKLFHYANMRLIDIYPKHENYEMFFGNAFSLSNSMTSQFVKTGYKRTFEVFNQL